MASRVLTCPQCGAPLQWKGEAKVIECRYCKAHIVTDSGKRTDAAAQVTAAKPPSMVPIVALGALVSVGAAVAVFTGNGGARRRAGNKAAKPAVPAMAMKKLAGIEVGVPMAKLEKALGVKAKNGWLERGVKHEAFVSVRVRYEKKKTDLPRSVALERPHEGPLPKEMVARLKAQFGRGLKAKAEKITFNGPGINVHTSGKGLWVDRHTRGSKSDNKEAFLLAWKAVLHAAGQGPAIGAADARRLLGHGYPFADLAKIDATLTVDTAPKALLAQFPGAVHDGTTVRINVEPGIFASAKLSYKNEPGGKLEWIYLTRVGGATVDRAPLVKCLEGELGASEKHVLDHAKGRFTWAWEPKGELETRLHEGPLMGYFRSKEDYGRLGGWVAKIGKCP